VNAAINPKLPDKFGPRPSDIAFLIFLFVAMLGIGWVGYLAYKEGLKVEVTKRNGEAWAKWFSDAGVDRGKVGYEFSACATGFLPIEAITPPTATAPHTQTDVLDETKPETLAPVLKVAPPPALVPRTWGPCFKAISTQGGPLAEKYNPFSQKPIAIVAKCDMADRGLAGAMTLEKTLPTPPGSAIPFISSPLTESDSIEQKLQIRITMCDKGAYPIRIAELEF
jgi:hypothetical protein